MGSCSSSEVVIARQSTMERLSAAQGNSGIRNSLLQVETREPTKRTVAGGQSELSPKECWSVDEKATAMVDGGLQHHSKSAAHTNSFVRGKPGAVRKATSKQFGIEGDKGSFLLPVTSGTMESQLQYLFDTHCDGDEIEFRRHVDAFLDKLKPQKLRSPDEKYEAPLPSIGRLDERQMTSKKTHDTKSLGDVTFGLSSTVGGDASSKSDEDQMSERGQGGRRAALQQGPCPKCGFCTSERLSVKQMGSVDASHSSSNSCFEHMLAADHPTVEAMRTVFDTVLEAIVVSNENGVIEMVNATALEMLGYRKKEDLVGHSINKIIEMKHKRVHSMYLKNYLKSGKGKIIGTRGREVNVVSSKGELIPILLAVGEGFINANSLDNTQEIMGAANSPERKSKTRFFVAVFHDIRQRKKLEQAEKEKAVADADRTAMQNFLQCTSHDLRTPLQAAQHAVQAIRDELDATDMLLQPDLREAGTGGLVGLPEDESNNEGAEVNFTMESSATLASSLLSLDPTEIGTRFGSNAVGNSGGRSGGLSPTMAQKLARKLKLLREMSTIISSSMMLSDLIISNVLDIQKIQSNTLEVLNQRVNLSRKLSDMVKVIRTSTTSKDDVALVDKVMDGMPMVYCDYPKILRVVMNLLTNALKFTEKGQVVVSVRPADIDSTSKREKLVYHRESAGNSGISREKSVSLPNTTKGKRKKTISITAPSTTSSGDSLMTTTMFTFTVEDTGRGMTKEQAKAALQPYVKSAASKGGGMGLGLYISDETVRALGGELIVESEVGVGTKMTFTIPIMVPTSAPASPALVRKVASFSHTPTRSLRILFVEDVPLNRKLGVSMLRSLGHKVTQAENGKVALDLLMKTLESNLTVDQESIGDGLAPLPLFDLVFMDHFMPIMDGLEAVKLYRNYESSNADLMEICDIAPVRLCALTADVSSETQQAFRAAGCDDFLSKPFSKDDMVQFVERVCNCQ